MRAKLAKIVQMADEAEKLLYANSRFTSSEGHDPLEEQKRTTFQFVKAVKIQATEGKLEVSAIEKMDIMNRTIADVSVKDREPSFECVSSYKACKTEAESTEDKILCGVALAICFAKEVIPLAK